MVGRSAAGAWRGRFGRGAGRDGAEAASGTSTATAASGSAAGASGWITGAAIGARAARQLEEDAAERVEVGARVHRSAAAALLRGHVRGRAYQLAAAGAARAGRLDLAHQLGHAEVEDLDGRLAVGGGTEEDVRRL